MKIKRKGILKDILYHEAYDKIHIYADGDWSLSTSGTVDPYEYYVISRSFFYNKTHKEIDRLIKYYENLLDTTY